MGKQLKTNANVLPGLPNKSLKMYDKEGRSDYWVMTKSGTLSWHLFLSCLDTFYVFTYLIPFARKVTICNIIMQ